MSTPAVIILCLTTFTLGIKAVSHGREMKVSFPLALVDAAIVLCLLWCGGFFD
jgi:hypothetical protein